MYHIFIHSSVNGYLSYSRFLSIVNSAAMDTRVYESFGNTIFPEYMPRSETAGSLIQFSSDTESCLTLCDLMDCSTPGLPVQHQLREFTQTHVH